MQNSIGILKFWSHPMEPEGVKGSKLHFCQTSSCSISNQMTEQSFTAQSLHRKVATKRFDIRWVGMGQVKGMGEPWSKMQKNTFVEQSCSI